MKKFFKLAKKSAGGDQDKGLQKAPSETSLSGPGYSVKEKDLGKLHKAAWHGDLTKVRQLAKKDASPLDKENRTPLHLACAKGHTEVVQTLLEWKAKLNLGDNDARTPLMKAVQCGQVACAKSLLESRADPNTTDKSGDTCLHYAARDGSQELTELLMAIGNINPNIQNNNNEAALHIAVHGSHASVVLALCRGGADLDSQDGEGRTALMCACQDDAPELVEVLVQNKANIGLKDIKGWTADDIALMGSHDRCRDALTAGGQASRRTSAQSRVSQGPGAVGEAGPPEFGGPALDEADESLIEDSASKISEAAGLDSWNDTDEDSDFESKKKDVAEEAELPAKAAASPRRSIASTRYEDIAEEDEPQHNSFDESMDDNEPVPEKKIPGLDLTKILQGSVENLDESSTNQDTVDEESEWSDNDGGLLDSARGEKPKLPLVTPSKHNRNNNTNLPKENNKTAKWDSDEDSDVEPQPVSKTKNNSPKGRMGLSKEREKGPNTEKNKAIMAELGLSDVSDVSDPELSESMNMSPPGGAMRAKVKSKEPESDWDSASDINTPRGPGPSRARLSSTKSAGSGWDSIEEDKEEDAGGKRAAEYIEKTPEKVSHPSPTADLEVKDAEPVKDKEIAQDPAVAKAQDGSTADSPDKKSVKISSAATGGHKEEEEDSDAWDSDEELPMSFAENNPVAVSAAAMQDTPDAVAKSPRSGMYGDDSEEEEEETESEWEKEKREKQENLQRQASQESLRELQWEEEFERRQEQLRLEAKEELRREQEEIEKQRREEETELEERRKEQETKQEEIRKEDERKLEEKRREDERKREEQRLEEERREHERKEGERQREEERTREEERLEEEKLREEVLRQEEERRQLAEEERMREERWRREKEEQERVEAERKEAEEKEKALAAQREAELMKEEQVLQREEAQLTAQSGKNAHPSLQYLSPKRLDDFGEFSEEEDLHEFSLRGKPDGIQREQMTGAPTVTMTSEKRDKDDSFQGVDVPEMESPVRHASPQVTTMNSSFTYGHSANGHHRPITPDDDGLSYSSTECDASVHEPSGMNSFINGTHQTNLTFGSDSMSIARLQEQLREARRQLDKERSHRTSVENKRKTLEKEKSDLIQKLEDVMRAKSNLEQTKIDLEAKMRALQYNLSEEVEKARNLDVLMSKTKDQLTRKDAQYTDEVESKQKLDLQMRNLQMELRTSSATNKQLEEEKDDVMRKLQHERNARQLQEQISSEQSKFREALHQENSPEQSKSMQLAAALSKLEEVDEGRKSAVESAEKQRAELYAVKMELEHQRARFKDDLNLTSSENESLKVKIEELKGDVKLNEEALAQATMQYNVQISQLRTDNAVLSSNLEKEKGAKEKYEVELESLRSRLQSASTEIEKVGLVRNELERTSQRSHEEWCQKVERRDSELSNLKEGNNNLNQRLSNAESKLRAIENELHIANATLAERSTQLATLQRDLEQRRLAYDTLDDNYRKEKEDGVRLSARMETNQDRITSLVSENSAMRQQIDNLRTMELSHSKDNKEDKFGTLLNSLRDDHEKARQALEDKNTMLNESVLRLRDEVRDIDARRTSAEQELRRAQMDLTDSHKRCSVAEASLEVANKSKDQMETERNAVRVDLEKLQSKLEAAKEKHMEAQAKVTSLTEQLGKAERSAANTSVRMADTSANAEEAIKTRAHLETVIRQLELEKVRLESSLQQEQQKVDMLQRDVNDSQQIKLHLEDEMNSMRNSHTQMKIEMNEATAAKTLASHEAEDSRDLWESEVKARSKLGLRIAQLERQKQEALSQVDEEKRKTRKAMDLKKSAEAKLTSESEKTSQLSKEVSALRQHLKAAKKRLKLDDVQQQLTAETEGREHLECSGQKLQAENTQLRTVEKAYNKLNKAKRKLEEDYVKYKPEQHVTTNCVDKNTVEALRADLEARARTELNKKLEEVNAYLEEQARARERLDKLRDSNEMDMRTDFDRTRKELMEELSKVRNSYNETQSERETRDMELQRFKDLYESELKLRERLANKLEEANNKAAKASMFIERSRLQPGMLAENGWMGSSGGGGYSSFPGKPSHGINDVLSHKMRAELDRSISKHLEKGPQIDVSLPPRSLDDSALATTMFNKSSSEYLRVLKKNYML